MDAMHGFDLWAPDESNDCPICGRDFSKCDESCAEEREAEEKAKEEE